MSGELILAPSGTYMELRDGGPLLGVMRTFQLWSCPACDWQIDVSSKVVAQDWDMDLDAFDRDLEDELLDHVTRECPHPRLIEALWRDRGAQTF